MNVGQVQSRGRSIAEVQVCGVKAAATSRPRDLSLSLSVHSLLLVDALQTYGPDFELLVASHKHVGSVSHTSHYFISSFRPYKYTLNSNLRYSN